MKIRSAVSAVALALVSICSAQAAVYTYTGNLSTFDSISSEPARIVAHFEFDFENSPDAGYHVYAFKSWDVSYADIKLSSAAGHVLQNHFTFDAAKNVTGWFFDATSDVDTRALAIQSLSKDFLFYAPNEATDISVIQNPLAAAYVFGAQGNWSIASSVPEPATYLMLGLGLAAVGFASRKRQG